MEKQSTGRTYLALIITMLLWSSAFAGIRAGLAAYSPGHVALLRFLVASAVLIIYATITRLGLPEWKDVPQIALLGFLGITVYHVALNYGEVSVTAGAASLLIGAVPAITALIATIFLKERLKVWGWVGIAVSFSGVALIALGEGEGFQFDPGAGLILIAAIATSIYFVGQKPLFERYSAMQMTCYTLWAGTLFMLVFLPGLPQAISTAPINATLAIVYLGIFPAAIAYLTWTIALSRIPASVVTSFLYVNPVLAILIAWVWIKEVPDPLSLVGGGLAIAGVVIVNRLGR
ncbi:MAG: DMT family transporter [Anaerolineae bacterium]|nr:DMT family transporter [Anaerolineae bacterium]